jgi:hypothetical protein
MIFENFIKMREGMGELGQQLLTAPESMNSWVGTIQRLTVFNQARG